MRRRGGRRGGDDDEEEDGKEKAKFYLRLEGVKGPVWGGEYGGCFIPSSFQYGQGRGIGGGGRRGRGKRQMSSPSVSECTLTLNTYDARVNMLHGLATAGALFKTAHIYHVTSDCVTTVLMTDVCISGFSTSCGGSSFSTSISLNYQALGFTTVSVARKPISIPAGLVLPTEPSNTLPDLGKDGYLKVFSWLSPSQLLSVALVCKQWLSLASDPRLLLKETSSFEYHPDGNTVIDGLRIPKPLLGGYDDNNHSDDDDGDKKEAEPVIYGAEPTLQRPFPFDAGLFQKE